MLRFTGSGLGIQPLFKGVGAVRAGQGLTLSAQDRSVKKASFLTDKKDTSEWCPFEPVM